MLASAFILAAGEGTRLRPLTDTIPKPLIPVFHKPLLTFALDHFLALGIPKIGLNARYLYKSFYREFSVNSESLSPNGEKTYQALGSYEGHPLHLFREPLPIDSAGALRNARAFLEEGPCLLHNGDILSTISLAPLIEHHRQSGSIATLLLREEGGLKNVSFNESRNAIVDIRGKTKKGSLGTLFFYPGIAILEPALLDWIRPKEGPACLIDALLAALQAGCKIAGLVSREGFATDLGTPEAYLKAHRDIMEQSWNFPYPLRGVEAASWPEAIHPTAKIAPSAKLHKMVVLGPHTRVEAHAQLHNCILLPEASVAAGAEVSDCIILSSSIS